MLQGSPLKSILLPTQLLSLCFSLDLFAQLHPVASCLNPSFDLKKAKHTYIHTYIHTLFILKQAFQNKGIKKKSKKKKLREFTYQYI